MHYVYTAYTTAGACRDKNEDRVMINGNLLQSGFLKGQTDDTFLAVICDGVGGRTEGERAADIATLNFRESCEARQTPESLSEAVSAANQVVLEAQQEARNNHQTCKDMATTVAGLYLDRRACIAFNAGDTRVYQYKSGKLTLLSTDHTLLEATLKKTPHLDPEVFPASYANIITEYLGRSASALCPAIRAHQGEGKTHGLFLLCSDGAYKSLTAERLEGILAQNIDADAKCRNIYEQALGRGSHDDISIVIVEACEG